MIVHWATHSTAFRARCGAVPEPEAEWGSYCGDAEAYRIYRAQPILDYKCGVCMNITREPWVDLTDLLDRMGL